MTPKRQEQLSIIISAFLQGAILLIIGLTALALIFFLLGYIEDLGRFKP